MMHDIKNLTNSPYDIRVEGGGKVRLPARGTLENIKIDRMHLPLYRIVGYFELTESNTRETGGQDTQDNTQETSDATSNDPEDDVEDEIEELRARYTELKGEEPDGRWGVKRLQEELAE